MQTQVEKSYGEDKCEISEQQVERQFVWKQTKQKLALCTGG